MFVILPNLSNVNELILPSYNATGEVLNMGFKPISVCVRLTSKLLLFKAISIGDIPKKPNDILYIIYYIIYKIL